MIMKSLSGALSVTALLVPLAATQATNLNPGGVGCVDPTGYTSCYQTSANNFGTCATTCSKFVAGSEAYLSCAKACSAVNWATNIGCWMQSCWNQIYSCRYQGTAIQYIYGTDLLQTSLTLPIPYYPTPEGAPGACSCNLGEVYGNMTDLLIANIPKCSGLAGDASATFDCECCQTSQIYSNIFNICPNSNLSYIGFNTFFATEQKTIETAQTDLSKVEAILGGAPLGNCTILDTAPNTCASTYGLPIKGSKWWNPLALPAGVPGTAALSDVAGSITVPPWGNTPTTLSLFPAFTMPITPATFNSKNAATTTAAGGGGGGGGSGGGGSSSSGGGNAGATATGTGTGAGNTASGSSTEKSGGNILTAKLWAPCLFALPAMALAYL